MIISVASGKGGTGKTLVSTSLALSLKDSYKIMLLDCDVEEPNAHVLLRPVFNRSEPVCIPVPEVDESKCTYCGKCAKVCTYHALAVFPKTVLVFPQLCHGCGACSYLCPQKAISEEMTEIGIIESGNADGITLVHGKLNVGEAMPSPVIRKVKEYIDFKSTVIIDVPPGTSCPVVESIKGSDFCLLVTEPTPFGFHDLELAIATVCEMGIPFGVVINRCDMGDNNVEHYCNREKIPVLMRSLLISQSHGITQ